jgi:hypothetical protein
VKLERDIVKSMDLERKRGVKGEKGREGKGREGRSENENHKSSAQWTLLSLL